MSRFPGEARLQQLTRGYQANFEADTYPRIQLVAGVATAGMTHAKFPINSVETIELFPCYETGGGVRVGWIFVLIHPRR